MLKNIIFDAYGTLFDTGIGSVKATEQILNNINANKDATEIYREWKRLHREHINVVNHFITEEEIFIKDLKCILKKYGINADATKEIYPMLSSLYNRKLFPDVMDMLTDLKDYNIVIGSTTDTKPLLNNIEQTKLPITNAFTSESLKAYKPNRQFYLGILNAMKWNADETVFVGDSLIDDVAGPKSVGIKTIWLNRKQIVPNKFAVEPDGIINNLYELSDCIRMINSIN